MGVVKENILIVNYISEVQTLPHNERQNGNILGEIFSITIHVYTYLITPAKIN